MPSERDEHKTATATSRTKRSRSKKRTPLANLTNAPIPLKLAKPTDPPSCTSVRGPRSERHGVLDNASVVAASPPRGESSNLGSGGDAVNRDEPEPLTNTEHIARGIQARGKKPCTSSSCPPVQRIKSINKDKLVDDTYNDRRKALSVQLQKPKKSRTKAKAAFNSRREQIGMSKREYITCGNCDSLKLSQALPGSGVEDKILTCFDICCLILFDRAQTL